MKYIKYLTLSILVSLMATSCEEKTVDFGWEPVDSGKVLYQVYYMSLVKANADNNIKYLTVNGTEYSYDHAALIAPYNFVPSGVAGSFYTGNPGQYSIKLETETEVVSEDPETGETIINYVKSDPAVYEGMTEESLEAGKKYQIVVWNNTHGVAPKVFEFLPIPTYDEVDEEGNNFHASGRLYNFLFDAEGKPTEATLYYGQKNKSKGVVENWYPEGGVKFGEASDYFAQVVDPVNANRSEKIYYDIKAVYPDGTEKTIVSNDYWTTYVGGAYMYFVYGATNKDVRIASCYRFSAM